MTTCFDLYNSVMTYNSKYSGLGSSVFLKIGREVLVNSWFGKVIILVASRNLSCVNTFYD